MSAKTKNRLKPLHIFHGDTNGLFTKTLKKVWNGGRFKKDLQKFHAAIVKRMPPWQAPNYFVVGAADPGFERQQPFTV